jgi:hypothetical protein
MAIFIFVLLLEQFSGAPALFLRPAGACSGNEPLGLRGQEGSSGIDEYAVPPYCGSAQYQIKTHVLPIGKRYFDRPASTIDDQPRPDDRPFFRHTTRVLDVSPVHQLCSAPC